jgi:hypothetical protein
LACERPATLASKSALTSFGPHYATLRALTLPAPRYAACPLRRRCLPSTPCGLPAVYSEHDTAAARPPLSIAPWRPSPPLCSLPAPSPPPARSSPPHCPVACAHKHSPHARHLLLFSFLAPASCSGPSRRKDNPSSFVVDADTAEPHGNISVRESAHKKLVEDEK